MSGPYTIHPHSTSGFTIAVGDTAPDVHSPQFTSLQDAYMWATENSGTAPTIDNACWDHDPAFALRSVCKELTQIKQRVERALADVTLVPTQYFDDLLAALDNDDDNPANNEPER